MSPKNYQLFNTTQVVGKMHIYKKKTFAAESYFDLMHRDALFCEIYICEGMYICMCE